MQLAPLEVGVRVGGEGEGMGMGWEWWWGFGAVGAAQLAPLEAVVEAEPLLGELRRLLTVARLRVG